MLAPGLADLAAVIMLIRIGLKCFVWEVHRKSRVQFP